MNTAKPIPKAVLPHTAVLKTPVASGIFTDGEYDELTLYNVRIETDERVRQSKNGETRGKGARLYYDCVNSAPADVKFGAEQLVVYGGISYKIESVRAVMGAGKTHHYLIELI